MRGRPRPPGLSGETALVAGGASAIVAAAVPLVVAGIVPSVSDVLVVAALAAGSVLAAGRGQRLPATLLALSAVLWCAVGLAPLGPTWVETPLSRLALVPHALVVATLWLTGQPPNRADDVRTARTWRIVGAATGLVGVDAVAAGLGWLDEPLLPMAVATSLAGAVLWATAQNAVLRRVAQVLLAVGVLWLVTEVLRAALTDPPRGLDVLLVDAAMVLGALGPAFADRRGALWAAAAEVDDDLDGEGGTGSRLGDRVGAALGLGLLELWFDGGRGPVDHQGRALDPRGGLPLLDDAGHPVAWTDRTLPSTPGVRRELLAVLGRAGRIATLRAEQRAMAEQVARSRAELLRAGDLERVELERRLRRTALARLDRVAVLAPVGGDLVHRVTEARADLLRLARGLDPLAGRGLAAALAGLVARDPRAVLDLGADGGGLDLCDPVAARTLYYVVSEGLANSAKHAPGSARRVLVTADEREGVVRVVVADDGPGGADPAGAGLRGLADRVAASGGVLEVVSGPAGTRLTASVPGEQHSPERVEPVVEEVLA